MIKVNINGDKSCCYYEYCGRLRVVAEDETDAQPTAGLWRERDGTGLSEAESPAATLSRGERPALAWTGFYCFS